MVVIRRYEPRDAVDTWRVFTAAVRGTAVRDYAEAAVREWALDDVDEQRWAARRAAAHTFVTCHGERVAFVAGEEQVEVHPDPPSFDAHGVAFPVVGVPTASDRR